MHFHVINLTVDITLISGKKNLANLKCEIHALTDLY